MAGLANRFLRGRTSRKNDRLDPRRYDLDFMFPGDCSRGSASAERRRRARLHRVAPRLRRVLRADEQVRMVAVGTRGSDLEMLLLGGLLELAARTMVIVTTQRVLLLQLTSRDEPRDAMAQVRFEYITHVSATTIGTLTISTSDGQHLIVNRTNVRDATTIRALLREVMRETPHPTAHAHRALCPGCANVLDYDRDDCPACHEILVPRWKPGVMSFAWPGLGELYSGYRAMGVVAVLATAFLWVIWLTKALETPENAGLIIPLVLGWHGVNGLSTWYTTRRGRRLLRHAWGARLEAKTV